jgi:hypothetical protein
VTWRNSSRCSSRSSSESSFAFSIGLLAHQLSAVTLGIATAFAVLSIGCETPPAVVPSGEPMLIVEGCGKVRLTAMKPDGTWLDLGWRDAASLHGYTVVAYDWQLDP